MEIASRRVDEPGTRGRNGVGGKGRACAVEADDEFIGEIIADLNAGGGVVVLDGVGVRAGEIERVVIYLSGRRGFERDGGAGEADGGAVVGDEVVLDFAAGVGGGGAVAKGDGAIAVQEKVVGDDGARCGGVEMDGGLGRSGCAGDGVEGIAADGPASAALSVDGGGGGGGKRAVGDGALIGAGLEGESVSVEVAEGEV